jgi:hypothetical protein
MSSAGRPRLGWWVGAPVVAGAALAAGIALGGSTTSSQVAPVVTQQPVRAFAPLVRLHAAEDRYPLSAEDFVQHSMLTWGIEGCPVEQIAQGRSWPDPNVHGHPWTRSRRLGGERPYTFEPPAEDCDRRFSRSHATMEHTRPYDAGRDPELRPDEGFFLDITTHRYGGRRALARDRGRRSLLGVPVYFDRRPERVGGDRALRIEYWWLFAFTDSPADTGLPSHEGGWERVSVLLRRVGRHRYLPDSARFHVHGRTHDVPWSDIALAGDSERASGPAHPVVYSARGSHVPIPAGGGDPWEAHAEGRRVELREETRACSLCPRWRTWERLLPVREQPWWGYGGGWGIAYEGDRTSGPLGPSPHLLRRERGLADGSEE